MYIPPMEKAPWHIRRDTELKKKKEQRFETTKWKPLNARKIIKDDKKLLDGEFRTEESHTTGE